LLLLDLKMPRLDGFEVLKWLRQQPEWRALPVAVLTASSDVRDVNAAFALGANSFMIKPVDFMWFAEFAQALAGSWLWLSEAPNHAAVPATTGAGQPFPA
jgi:CheY-like chemotaxis protein